MDNYLDKRRTGDPLGKAGRDIQSSIEQWSLKRANGNPREFANHYEYARAIFGTSREVAKDMYQGQKNAERKAIARATNDITSEKLTAKLEEDLNTVAEDFGSPAQLKNQSFNTDLDELTAAIRNLEDIGFESPAAAVYHARKHGGELPISYMTGNVIDDYTTAARYVIRTGEYTLDKNAETSSIRAIVRKDFVKEEKKVLLEAIVYTTNEGRVTLATFGEGKTKQ